VVHQVALVDDTVGALREHKGRCDELTDVRRLKLRQLLQLRTAERDIDQVVQFTDRPDHLIFHCDQRLRHEPSSLNHKHTHTHAVG